MRKGTLPALAIVTFLASGCEDKGSAPTAASSAVPGPAASSPTLAASHGGIERAEFNQAAARLDLPVYWTADKNHDGSVDADEVVSLSFYPTGGHWVEAGKLTPAFDDAFARIKGHAWLAKDLPAEEAKRRDLVVRELDQGAPTLVYTELRTAAETDKALVRHILAAAAAIDDLYATMTGAKALESRVPKDDPASLSMFRRNWGPRCLAPKTEKDPACSAIPGAPKLLSDLYPAALQKDPKFCDALEKLPGAKALLDHFVVVRDQAGKLAPVSYAEAYKTEMQTISGELAAAADAVTDPGEAPFKAYLEAASQSFLSNDWSAADEAWARMNANNSKWYLRVAPDEVYWEPCNHKAGFHVTFARINQGSLEWQEKLNPVEDEMEKTLATLIGAPYAARKVTFHLPDFIDIVFNAGDDRTALGATIGQSLPNWGKVVADGRGRTVAMSNLYTDPDSLAARRKRAESLLDAASMKLYADSPEPGLLSTILHEASHNLGPAHEYALKGKTDEQAFGGGLATMLEELKAQSGGLYFIEFLRKKGLVTDALAGQSYADDVVWALGHISEGMYSESGKRKPYPQLAAIQVGFLMDDGALTFDANAMAANGTDKGAFTLHADRLPASSEKLMKLVGGIKAQANRAAAEELSKKYVDGDTVPHKLIAERELRFPKASFVYAIDMQ